MMRIIIITIFAAVLSACSTSIYRLGIQQGNIVTDEMLEKLKPGMTERQVRYVMGNPVIRNSLNKDRWDYLYRFEREGSFKATYHVTLIFDEGKYVRYEGSNKGKQSLYDPEPEEKADTTDQEQREETKTEKS